MERDGDMNVRDLEDELGGDVFFLNEDGTYEPREQPQPSLMTLSQEEANLAWELVRQVEADSELTPLTDMQYAHHALASEGNLQEAMQSIRGMQKFRETFRPQDTVEEYVSHLEEYIRINPGVLLHADMCADTGTAFMAFNCASFDPSVPLASEQNFRNMALLDYYMFQTQHPTLHSVREGVYYLAECKGMAWSNYDATFEQRYHDEVYSRIPVKIKYVLVYNNNSIANVVWALCKSFMGPDWKDIIKMGCEIEPGPDSNCDNKLTLNDIYLQPSYDVAMRNMVERAKQLLTMRYQNERSYKLP